MKIRMVVLMASLATASSAMGRAATDPATWGDVENTNAAVANNFVAQQNEIAATNDSVSQVNDRISKLEETKIFVETDIRLYDAKRVTVSAFNMADVKHGSEFGAGLRIGLKIGQSYEERLIKKQQAQLEALTDLLRRSVKP